MTLTERSERKTECIIICKLYFRDRQRCRSFGFFDKNIDKNIELAECVTCDETNTRTKLNSAAHRYNDHVCEICYAIDPSAPETDGLEFYPITKNNGVVGYEVKSIGSAANDRYIKIPSSYNGLPVTGLMNYSFKAGKCLNIEIPSSVTYLGRAVFQDNKIRSIVIPNTVTEVGDYLFQECEYLIDAKISDNVTRIGTWFFIDCVRQSNPSRYS